MGNGAAAGGAQRGQALTVDRCRVSHGDPKDLPQLGEADMQSLLRLLAQFGEAAHGGTKAGRLLIR